MLENAIVDVGYWQWWTANLPESFQVEFGGVLLWNPPLKEGDPPSGVVALRFLNPSCVCFLRRRDHPRRVPKNWYERLHRDEIRPFEITYEAFTLTSDEQVADIVSAADSIIPFVGSKPVKTFVPKGAKFLAFWAGPVGLFVAAQSMEIFNLQGEIKPATVKAKSAKWWRYWKEYWRRKGTSDALPKDYACEVTIPAAEED